MQNKQTKTSRRVRRKLLPASLRLICLVALICSVPLGSNHEKIFDIGIAFFNSINASIWLRENFSTFSKVGPCYFLKKDLARKGSNQSGRYP